MIAPASATTAGSGVLDVSAMLVEYPCVPGVCSNLSGLLSGTGAMSLSGLSSASVPYSAVWTATTGNFSGDVRGSSDTCEFGLPAPVQGYENGTFTLSGGVFVIGATTYSATLTGSYALSRLGAAVTIQLTQLTITGGPNTAVNLPGSISSPAPVAMVWTNGPGTCQAPQTNQTALIAGLVLQPT